MGLWPTAQWSEAKQVPLGYARFMTAQCKSRWTLRRHSRGIGTENMPPAYFLNVPTPENDLNDSRRPRRELCEAFDGYQNAYGNEEDIL